jgi:hypothetical protein
MVYGYFSYDIGGNESVNGVIKNHFNIRTGWRLVVSIVCLYRGKKLVVDNQNYEEDSKCLWLKNS